MKAISLTEPWAALAAYPVLQPDGRIVPFKEFETRSPVLRVPIDLLGMDMAQQASLDIRARMGETIWWRAPDASPELIEALGGLMNAAKEQFGSHA